jgi:hypothetical protein
MTKKVKKDNKLKELMVIFDGDVDLALFYLIWIKNGLNASKAYKELHPDVDEHSARTLGSRALARVDKSAILQAYGLDHQLYFQQLKDGVKAEKRDQFTGEMSPDHKTRKEYHDKLGKMLGLEQDKPEVLIQQNFIKKLEDERKEFEV